jgi:dihydroflavonol-4-reductase
MSNITVVTGASGLVGANMIRNLLEQGRGVRALIHADTRAIEGLDIEVADGNVCNPESLYPAFEGADVVYHLAARISLSMRDWPLVEQVNITGTRNVVDACIKCGVSRLVYFSSIHAYIQEPYHIPVDESRPLADSAGYPPYDRSKAGGKKEVLRGIEKGLDAIIIHPTAIIGPYDYKMSYLNQALLSMAAGKLPALIDGGFDWVDVRDVVAGAIKAEEVAACGSDYLLSGHWASMAELAKIIEEITGKQAPGLVCPLWLAYVGVPVAAIAAWITHTRPIYTGVALKAIKSNRNICYDKAAKDIGYHPRPLRETIYETLMWFRKYGYVAFVEAGKTAQWVTK